MTRTAAPVGIYALRARDVAGEAVCVLARLVLGISVSTRRRTQGTAVHVGRSVSLDIVARERVSIGRVCRRVRPVRKAVSRLTQSRMAVLVSCLVACHKRPAKRIRVLILVNLLSDTVTSSTVAPPWVVQDAASDGSISFVRRTTGNSVA